MLDPCLGGDGLLDVGKGLVLGVVLSDVGLVGHVAETNSGCSVDGGTSRHSDC